MNNILKLAAPPNLSSAAAELAAKYKKANPSASALVLGPTGEVGREVLRYLLASNAYSKVVVLTRREIEYDGPNKEAFEQITIDYDKLNEFQHVFERNHQCCFCCLGTTRGKNGKDFFYKVDHDYVIASAQLAKKANIPRFSVCSASNARSDSWFFYSKVKGQVEDELTDMKFNKLSIFKPAFLECDREESRLGERIASVIIKPFKFIMPTILAVPTTTVGKAMVYDSLLPLSEETPHVSTFTNPMILTEGGKM
ncbi:hypothetical protein BB560_004008 [Smittium megazygosporum]|uniref:NAD(P)-binding domain-containing protein n=1 Tax=Smittium megazygosporum TaxID=133381 RepID=A0A2T9ZAC9_9FUNG|nr:hypothetical protein BB560_004008 [Smittium megazygosporum]